MSKTRKKVLRWVLEFKNARIYCIWVREFKMREFKSAQILTCANLTSVKVGKNGEVRMYISGNSSRSMSKKEISIKK